MTDAPKPPWHLWVIAIMALLWNGFGAIDFTLTFTRFEPYVSQYPPAMMDYIHALPIWNWIGWAIGVWGGFAGSILLLMRKKSAVWVYAFSLAGAVGSNALTLLDPPPAEVGGSPVLIIIIIAIAAVLLAYAMWLKRKGVLH